MFYATNLLITMCLRAWMAIYGECQTACSWVGEMDLGLRAIDGMSKDTHTLLHLISGDKKMRGSRLQGERKGAHKRDKMLPTGCVGKDDLSEGCQVSTPSSTEFTLFGYMLMHALSIER